MIGVLLVTHGNLAQELLNTCEMIAGKQENAEAVGLFYDDNINDLSQIVRERINQMDQGDGVLVFTDLYGGSPNSHTAVNLKAQSFQQITGVNMPMLLECFSMRDSLSADQLAIYVKEQGMAGIKQMNELIKVK